MNAMRRVGLSVAVLAMLAAAAGCGGGSAGGMARPTAPLGDLADAAPATAAKSAPAGYPQSAPMADMGGSMPGQAREAPPPPASPAATSGAAPRAMMDEERSARKSEVVPNDRPGLGTEWGETRTSRISTVPFVRADTDSPFATTAFFYNDEEGARAMASQSGFRRFASGSVSAAGGLVSVGLRDEGGRFLSGFAANGKNFIVGEAGRRYSIVVRNNSNSRLEVVLSVDGLDVLDGKAAAFTKRGYLVDSRAEVEIDGFRQSFDTVAAFRFGSVRGSYAGQKTGDTRNVGVIGVALFNERGTNPLPWTADEVQQRRDANPFPGQFATPP